MSKVLIIEDDELLKKMYRQKLVLEGYQVVEATNGNKGLQLATSTNPDLILLDIMLPGGINGFDVLEQLKRSPSTENIAVLILTNLDSEAKVAQEIGAAGYLVKSQTTPGEVINEVKKILMTRNAPDVQINEKKTS
jgi:DNA-binding response OmpR family regulator